MVFLILMACSGWWGLLDLAAGANRMIREEMVRNGVDLSNRPNRWLTAFAAVRLSDKTFEWAQIGDCLIVVIYQDNSFKLLVEDYDHDAEALMAWKRLADQGKRDIIKLVYPHLVKIWNNYNKDYGVLNGDEEFIKFINRGRESLKGVRHVLLFTDGLFVPKEDPGAEDDFGKFVELFLEGGLERVRDYVRGLEKGDPNCWKYPRYKQHDDIAAIAISFG